MIRSAPARLTVVLVVPLILAVAARCGDKSEEKIPLKGINGKGKVGIPIYKLMMAKGVPYTIEAVGTGFEPRVTIMGEYFPSTPDFKNHNVYKAIFTPRQTKDYLVAVLPERIDPQTSEGPFEYTLKVRPILLAAKPMLQVAGKFTDQDMKLNDESRNTYYKSYPIKLKAGRTYSIDLVHPAGSTIDPYLLLKDGEQIVARDDDSGGDLNARIIYTAPKDGEFTIIATTLRPGMTGAYTLTVRGPAEKKK